MSAQSMQALAHANVIRIEQARFKREVFAMSAGEGRRKLAAGLLDGLNEEVEGLRLADYLKAARKVGPRQLRQIADDSQIIRSRCSARLRDLTKGERRRVADELMRRATHGRRAA